MIDIEIIKKEIEALNVKDKNKFIDKYIESLFEKIKYEKVNENTMRNSTINITMKIVRL